MHQSKVLRSVSLFSISAALLFSIGSAAASAATTPAATFTKGVVTTTTQSAFFQTSTTLQKYSLATGKLLKSSAFLNTSKMVTYDYDVTTGAMAYITSTTSVDTVKIRVKSGQPFLTLVQGKHPKVNGEAIGTFLNSVTLLPDHKQVIVGEETFVANTSGSERTLAVYTMANRKLVDSTTCGNQAASADGSAIAVAGVCGPLMMEHFDTLVFPKSGAKAAWNSVIADGVISPISDLQVAFTGVAFQNASTVYVLAPVDQNVVVSEDANYNTVFILKYNLTTKSLTKVATFSRLTTGDVSYMSFAGGNLLIQASKGVYLYNLKSGVLSLLSLPAGDFPNVKSSDLWVQSVQGDTALVSVDLGSKKTYLALNLVTKKYKVILSKSKATLLGLAMK